MTQTPDFDAVYRADPDPWGVATHWYERRKRQVVLACLRAERYGTAWDIACGTGALAADLARRCDAVVATDGSDVAVRLARAELRDLANVTVSRLTLPSGASETPVEHADLIVISEVLYYLDTPDRAATLELADTVSDQGTELLLAHWTPRPHDGWASGQGVHKESLRLLTGIGWRHALSHVDEQFVADVLVRTR